MQAGFCMRQDSAFSIQTATLPVVVIHIVIYLLHQFVHRQFTCVIETLRLQHRKEAFHRRIVPTVRLTRHALNHGMLRKQFPIPRRTVQHTLVRMQHRSFISQTGAAFFEHFLHHVAVGSAAHGVGDDLAVEQVQDWREVQFAVLPFEFGHVGQPFFVGLSGCEQTFEEVFRYFAHGGMAVGFFARMRAFSSNCFINRATFCGSNPMLRQCAFARSVLYAAGRFRRGGLCRLRRGRVGLGGGSKSCFWAGLRCAAGI